MKKQPQKLDVQMVVDDPDLQVWDYSAGGDMLAVCFTGIGPDPSVTPGPEFIQTATGRGKNSALFIIDPLRSWLNAPGQIEKIVATIESKAAAMKANRIVTLGHSMGGFMAAVLPGFTKIDTAVCMSPQLSVDPDLVPDERRWMQHRKRIKDIRIRSAGDHIAADTLYYMFFGDHRREAPQRALVPEASNVKYFLLPGITHNTPQRMKRANVLNDVVQFSFQRRTHLLRRILRNRFRAVQIELQPDTGMTNPNGQTPPEGESANDKI